MEKSMQRKLGLRSREQNFWQKDLFMSAVIFSLSTRTESSSVALPSLSPSTDYFW